MRVEILASVAGPNWRARPGQRIALPDAEAKSLIRAGVARAIDPEPVLVEATPAEPQAQPEAAPAPAIEAAVAPEPENAAITTKRPGGRERSKAK
mgnify:CR=1 FL=1